MTLTVEYIIRLNQDLINKICTKISEQLPNSEADNFIDIAYRMMSSLLDKDSEITDEASFFDRIKKEIIGDEGLFARIVHNDEYRDAICKAFAHKEGIVLHQYGAHLPVGDAEPLDNFENCMLGGGAEPEDNDETTFENCMLGGGAEPEDNDETTFESCMLEDGAEPEDEERTMVKNYISGFINLSYGGVLRSSDEALMPCRDLHRGAWHQDRFPESRRDFAGLELSLGRANPISYYDELMISLMRKKIDNIIINGDEHDAGYAVNVLLDFIVGVREDITKEKKSSKKDEILELMHRLFINKSSYSRSKTVNEVLTEFQRLFTLVRHEFSNSSIPEHKEKTISEAIADSVVSCLEVVITENSNIKLRAYC